MRLYSLNDAPPRGPGLTVRESPFWTLLGAVFVFGGTGAMVWAQLAGHLPPIFWISAVFLVLFAALMLRSLTTVFSIENWRLHIGEEGIMVRIRTPLNRHLPRDDRVIAVIPWRDIASAHELRRSVTYHHARRRQYRSHAYAVFMLHHDAPELVEAIEAERNKSTPPGCISGGRFLHDVAVMEGARELRIELVSPNSRATPSTKAIFATLAKHIPISESAREEGEGSLWDDRVGKRLSERFKDRTRDR